MRFPNLRQSARLTAAFAMRPGLARRLFGPGQLERIHAVADLDEDLTISDFVVSDGKTKIKGVIELPPAKVGEFTLAAVASMLAASDYPHQIGSIPKMKSSLAALKVSDAERKQIMSENARKLYKL